jgi:hypothetical protein
MWRLLVVGVMRIFSPTTSTRKTAARKKFKESAIKTVEKIYGSSTGFNRYTMFIPRAMIALQDLLEFPK